MEIFSGCLSGKASKNMDIAFFVGTNGRGGITLNLHKFRKIFQYILFHVMVYNVGIFLEFSRHKDTNKEFIAYICTPPPIINVDNLK